MSKTAELFRKRLEEVDAEIEKAQKTIAKAQDALRKDNSDANRKAVQDAKEPMSRLADERADLARAVASASGGRNFAPPVT